MAYETTQSLDLERDKEYITQNKDILTKKIRWDNYLKGFSYFLYSLFVALLSLTFLFTGAREIGNNNFQYLDLVNVFVGLFALLISSWVISWVYKGSLKKLFTINYYVTHLFNAVILSIISIALSLPIFTYPVNGTIQEINNATQMQTLIFGLGMCAWFIVGGLALTVNLRKIKGTFPTSWLKWKLSLVNLFIFPVLAMISWAASLMPEMKTILLIVQLGVFVIGLLYSMFAYTYINSFKELILSDKTEKEIQKIEYFRNISFLMILVPSLTLVILGIVKALPLLNVWSSSTIEIMFVISIVVDALILIAYLFLIISFKRKGNKTKLLSSIDNSVLMDFITWLLLVKTVVIVGLSKGVEISVFMSLSSCFLAIFIINITNILMGVNFPNIKNTTSTIINLVASMAILGMALFQSTFLPESSSNIFEGAEIVILTILPALIASSINLGIKILGFAKINSFKFKKAMDNKKNENDFNKVSEQKNTAAVNKPMEAKEKSSKVGA
ncbi:MAG: hypothetical protein ACRCWU_02165 [Metamycoplasmataceae bacterium]